jgi:high-affinity iron transporter
MVSRPLTVSPRLKRYRATLALLVGVVAAVAVIAATAAQARTARTHRYLIAVPPGELRPALRTYRAYVNGLLNTLDGQVSALLSAEQSGQLSAAEADWLPAHLSWLEIGQDDGAYGAFGALGGEIDGTAAGLVGGTSSRKFTGFHRIEFDLWTEHDAAAAATDTVELQQLLAQLQTLGMNREMPGTASFMSDWVLRCHEILEDADRDSLTGNDDYGSGSDMASVTADVTATREMLTLLYPEIHAREPRLVKAIRGQLTALDRAALATQVNGAWVGLAAIPRPLEEQVNADTGAALERLAPISDLIRVVGFV